MCIFQLKSLFPDYFLKCSEKPKSYSLLTVLTFSYSTLLCLFHHITHPNSVLNLKHIYYLLKCLQNTFIPRFFIIIVLQNEVQPTDQSTSSLSSPLPSISSWNPVLGLFWPKLTWRQSISGKQYHLTSNTITLRAGSTIQCHVVDGAECVWSLTVLASCWGGLLDVRRDVTWNGSYYDHKECLRPFWLRL